MKKLIILVVVCWISSQLVGQETKINQFDAAGKKDGKWIIYLDAAWKEQKDSSKAIYYKYTFYDHGLNLYKMGPRDEKWSLQHTDSVPQKSKLKLLDGEYKWIDKNGKTRSIDVFKKGQYVMNKWFYSSGEIDQIFDYTKKYKGEPHSYCIYEYDKKGTLIRFFINRKGPQGWNFYKGSEDDLK